MLEHERFVDELLVAAVPGGLLECWILAATDFDHLGGDFSVHAAHRQGDLVDRFNQFGVGKDWGRLAGAL